MFFIRCTHYEYLFVLTGAIIKLNKNYEWNNSNKFKLIIFGVILFFFYLISAPVVDLQESNGKLLLLEIYIPKTKM